jgi:hypothetical protein
MCTCALFRTVSEIELFHCTDKQHAMSSHELQSVLSEIALSWKPFRIGHMYTYTFLLTVTSQNIDLSSWDILYSIECKDSRWDGKGRAHRLIEVLFKHLPGGTVGNYEKPVRIACVLKFQNQHLQNMSLERYTQTRQKVEVNRQL